LESILNFDIIHVNHPYPQRLSIFFQRNKLVFFCSWDKDINKIKESSVDSKVPHLLKQTKEIIVQSSNFDIIHNNYYDSYYLTAFSSLLKCPMLTTIHNDFPEFKHLNNYYQVNHRKGYDGYTFVSNFARKKAKLDDAFTVHNGIDISEFNFVLQPKNDNMLWLSRISTKKGAHVAIDVALKAGKPLIISGEYPTKEEYVKYFQNRIENNLSDTIQYTGQPTIATKKNLYGNSKIFIFPVLWEEPFGLVLIEAMASGTPIVAYARGGIPEIVKDGQTGFIVNFSENDKRGNWIVKKTGLHGLTEAVNKIYQMPKDEYRQMRLNCRQHVEENFTIEKMVDNYEKIYHKLLNKQI